MSASDLNRLQGDLHVLRRVVGGDLPFDRWDVRATLVTGGCALLPAVAGIFGAESRWVLLGSAVPFLVAVVSQLSRNFRASHPSKACPHEKRKEYRTGMAIMLACLPLIVGFRFWATSSGAPAAVANGSVLIFLGLLLLLTGVYQSGRRAWILPGLAAIVGGLTWPYFESLRFWTLLWSCTGVALIGSAVIMHRQLVSRRLQNEYAD